MPSSILSGLSLEELRRYAESDEDVKKLIYKEYPVDLEEAINRIRQGYITSRTDYNLAVNHGKMETNELLKAVIRSYPNMLKEIIKEPIKSPELIKLIASYGYTELFNPGLIDCRVVDPNELLEAAIANHQEDMVRRIAENDGFFYKQDYTWPGALYSDIELVAKSTTPGKNQSVDNFVNLALMYSCSESLIKYLKETFNQEPSLEYAVLHQKPRLAGKGEDCSVAVVNAARYGRMDSIKLLESNYTIPTGTATGMAINVAAYNNHTEVVKYLLDNYGVPIDLDKVLEYAVKNGNYEVAKHLLDKYTPPSNIADCINIAADNKNKELAKYLAEKW